MYHQQLCNQITFSFLNVETNNKGILLFIFISDHVQYGFNIFSPKNRQVHLTDLSVTARYILGSIQVVGN